MTHDQEYKIAKWLYRHGKTKRKDLPFHIPLDLYGSYKYFYISFVKCDKDGYNVPGDDDLFIMKDEHIDKYLTERRSRIHEFRDWLEPTGVVVANVIALIALIVSIYAMYLGQQ